jgi:hypothetical protein
MKDELQKIALLKDTPERAIIDLLFHYAVLYEYQLLDLQASVRGFVDRMSEAVSNIDGTLGRVGAIGRTQINAIEASLAAGQQTFSKQEMTNLLEAVRPAVNVAADVQNDLYTFIECLSFEDIQSQRLDHLAKSGNALNMGIIQLLNEGLETVAIKDLRLFCHKMARATRAMYTMPAEREVFDQVFYDFFEDEVLPKASAS